MNIERFIDIALVASLKSTHRVKIGAVLLRHGKPISIGWNKVGKTHPRSKWFIHAELDCLLGLHQQVDYSGTTMVIARQNRQGCVLYCQPCEQCKVTLKEYGVQKVIYTVGLPFKGHNLYQLTAI